jgi:hypothetical protein
MDYLENGGYLFASGSEIASDLDPDAYGSADEVDEAFLNNYLKINFELQQTEIDSVRGILNGIFDGFTTTFGVQPYPLSGVDIIAPNGEDVIPILQYEKEQYAGVQYQGTFGNGNSEGKLVLLSFPFETISSKEKRDELMARVIDYFFGPTNIAEKGMDTFQVPGSYRLFNSYPNPFNPKTILSYDLPNSSYVELRVYDILGKQVKTLVNTHQNSGHYKVAWDGTNQTNQSLPTGIYFAHLKARSTEGVSQYQSTVKLLFTK